VSERPDYPVDAERELGADPEQEQPVIRDKRRIDPLTGQVRNTGTGASAPAPAGDGTPRDVPDAPGADSAGGDVAAQLQQQVAERTADLQRVQAEYANYRRRVDRDREAVREAALANVLTNLLPVLDDIGRARDHGELEGGFKAVAEALEATVEKLGLARFGAEGDPFDPTVHEALTHELRPDVSETTCVRVFQVGYRIGERIVRPARVGVAEPGEDDGHGDAAPSTADPSTADPSTTEPSTSGAGAPAAGVTPDTTAPPTGEATSEQ